MAEKKPKIIPAIILIVVALLSGSVYVVQFGDVTSYSDENRVVIFKDKLGLPVIGKEIARMKITSHKDLSKPIFVGIKNQRVIIINLENKEDYKNALGVPEFVNLETGEIEELKYYWEKAIYEDVEVEDYRNVCEIINDVNGTSYEECEKIVAGFHTENKIIKWERLFTNDIPKGNITLALVVFVKPNTIHDAVINIFGKEIKKWATWTNDLTNGIMAYYQMNETSGTTMGEYFNGTLNVTLDGSWTAGGKIGGGYIGNGEASLRNLGFNLNGKSAVTLNMWLKRTASWEGFILGPYAGTWPIGTMLMSTTSPANLRIHIQDDTELQSIVISGAFPNLDQYRMVTVRINATDLYLYFNGVANMSFTLSNFAFNNENLIFVTWGGNDWNNGVIDELGIWGRWITDSEVTQLYNNDDGITPPAVAVDTCTYTSGNWEVDCADNCSISANVVGDGSNLIIDGTGKFTMDANISGFGKYIIKGACKTYCITGCFVN